MVDEGGLRVSEGSEKAGDIRKRGEIAKAKGRTLEKEIGRRRGKIVEKGGKANKGRTVAWL